MQEKSLFDKRKLGQLLHSTVAPFLEVKAGEEKKKDVRRRRKY
jgi:hypothetical protein